MNKWLKILLGVLGVILLGIGLLVIVFIFEMKPDQDEEDKVKIQAKQYLEEEFNEDFEIYDTLYDNMGNFSAFEYAANVKDKKTGTEFLVYYNEDKDQMVDTYIADKWEDDLKTKISPYLIENIEGVTEYYVHFLNREIGKELNIDPLQPRNYTEFDVRPIIHITVPRERRNDDEELIHEFITYLKSENRLKHGTVIMDYIAEDGVILDDQWRVEF